MVLGVAAIVLLSVLTLNRPPPPSFSAPEASGAARTPSPASATAEPPAPDVPRILVVGDAFTTPVPGATAWPELLRADLDAAGRPMEVTVTAADGSGYAQPGPGGVTFPLLAQQAGGGFDLVVFFGSRHDIAAAADVAAAADGALVAARSASPQAGLVVIGPAWSTPDPPGYIETNRDALAAAVVPSGAVFVDPLAEGWFSGTAPGLTTPDGLQPTAEGHRYLADLIRPVVERTLPAAN
jgi:hypothetical protein